MSLEAQLLDIIEEQQQQLKQQQQTQDQALLILQNQNKSIEELENYNKKLIQNSIVLTERIQEQNNILQRLKNPQLSELLSQELESNLKLQLKSHLNLLVNGLEIESQAKALIQESLPTMVQAEIDKQTKQLATEIKQKLNSVSNYHKKFEDLIREISSRL